VKYLVILFLFLFEFTIGQVPVNPILIPRSATSQTFTISMSLNADLTVATITAVTLNNGRSPVQTSGIIFGQTLPLTLSTDGATITTDGNISGGAYSNTFTVSGSNSSFAVAYATNSFGTSYGKVVVIPKATVTSTTGKVWMSYNLGASNIATSLDDPDAYGDLYQWGRIADGHQIVRTTISETTTTRSSSDNVNNGGKFIIGCSVCFGGSRVIVDWRTAANNSLWTTNTGNNNPCPTGFRVPTSSEFAAEMTSWTSQNGNGAFNSELKLPYAGRRIGDGSMMDVGTKGWYWTSTGASGTSNYRVFDNSSSGSNNEWRSFGLSVRCIKIPL
jgi:uncharacterized protein (TIGR02145 family)